MKTEARSYVVRRITEKLNEMRAAAQGSGQSDLALRRFFYRLFVQVKKI